MAKLFIIKRDERLFVLAVAVWLGFFQFLMIAKFWPLFSDYGVTTWTVFMKTTTCRALTLIVTLC